MLRAQLFACVGTNAQHADHRIDALPGRVHPSAISSVPHGAGKDVRGNAGYHVHEAQDKIGKTSAFRPARALVSAATGGG